MHIHVHTHTHTRTHAHRHLYTYTHLYAFTIFDLLFIDSYTMITLINKIKASFYIGQYPVLTTVQSTLLP